MSDFPELVTPKQVAEILVVSEASLANDRYLQQGIPYIKVGKRVRYRRADVIAFIDANTVEVSA